MAERSAERHPKYLNEAFLPTQQDADNFLQWLISDEGKDFRQTWFDSVQNHMVLRYVNSDVRRPVTDD